MADIIYGLIGRVLKHSFSVPIHKSLGCESYRLIELEPEALEAFFKNENFGGLNITIPYKKDVMMFCDVIDEEAKRVGSINTIVKEDGLVKGYNTDIHGLRFAIKRAGISVAGKKVIVFGSGGASLAALAMCELDGARETVVVSRSGENNYSNLGRHKDADVIINATPLGMYPNVSGMPADPAFFDGLSGVVDMVYNPSRTELVLRAEELGIPYTDGLPMLVSQAVHAEEIFFGKKFADEETERIISEIRGMTLNIILVGMPGSGKTTIAKKLSEITGRKLVDLDSEIVKSAGRSIEDIFSESGEAAFRKMESETASCFGKESGLIISCGGGIVKDMKNYKELRRNGRIYHIERDTKLLSRYGRPLSKGADLDRMYEERLPMYEAFRDEVVYNNSTPYEAATRIWEDFNENLGY